MTTLTKKSKLNNNLLSKSKFKTNYRTKKINRLNQKGGDAKIGLVKIYTNSKNETNSKQVIKLKCTVCGHHKFFKTQTKFDTSSGLKKAFFSDWTEILSPVTLLFNCITCGFVMPFKKNISEIEMIYLNR